jgi:hypothetical protein
MVFGANTYRAFARMLASGAEEFAVDVVARLEEESEVPSQTSRLRRMTQRHLAI